MIGSRKRFVLSIACVNRRTCASEMSRWNGVGTTLSTGSVASASSVAPSSVGRSLTPLRRRGVPLGFFPRPFAFAFSTMGERCHSLSSEVRRLMPRMVKCAKLGKELPAIPYKPFNNELGQRIYDNVSMEAWKGWLEFSKMIVNEYRLDLTSQQGQKLLHEQAEKYFFGEGAQMPPDYVAPPAK